MEEIKTVEVIIAGQVIKLRAAEGEEYLHKLARYTDKKILEIENAKGGAYMRSQEKTILIALNIADDYFKEKAQSDHAKKEAASLDKRFETEQAKLLQENQQLLKTIEELTTELGELKKSTADKLAAEKTRLAKELEDTRTELSEELARARKELDDYIEAFDKGKIKSIR